MTDRLERVLTKGVAFDVSEGTITTAEAGDVGVWMPLSIAGVGVLKIEAGVSWRSWGKARDEE